MGAALNSGKVEKGSTVAVYGSDFTRIQKKLERLLILLKVIACDILREGGGASPGVLFLPLRRRKMLLCWMEGRFGFGGVALLGVQGVRVTQTWLRRLGVRGRSPPRRC